MCFCGKNNSLQIQNDKDSLGILENARLLTFIDDDGCNSFYSKFVPIILGNNISISTAIETGRVGTEDYMDWNSIKECRKVGAEILNHSKYHIYSKVDSEKRSKDDVRQEMLESIKDMTEHGYHETADIWVYPGASAGATLSVASEIMRCGINSSGSEVNTCPLKNRYNLRRYPICSHETHTFEDMKCFVDELIHNPGWEIWMLHSHNGFVTEEFISDFIKIIEYCRQNNVQIVSCQQALDFYGINRK